MINIFRCNYDSPLNHFHGQKYVERDEVVIKEKKVNRSLVDSTKNVYRYVEPVEEGNWAFGGTLLYTSNGIYPEFSIPLKLHDRNMDLENCR